MMYKKQNTFAKKSFFSLLFIMILGVWGSLLFNSCKNIFETAIPSQEEDESASASSGGNTQESGTNESSLPPPVIVHGQIIITGAVPEVNSTVIQNGRAAVPAYIASEVEYFASATNGSTTVNGSFGSDDTATTFELPLTPGQDWSITCGLKKRASTDILFSASTDDPIDPEDLAEDTVLKFYPTPDVSGGESSTGEIDLSMTVDSSIVKYKTTCISDNSAYWPFSTPNPIEITGTTATIKTDSSNPSVRSGAYEVIIDFYKAGNVIAYSTVQTINVCKNLKTRKWIASGGTGPIESNGSFNVSAAKIASYVNTYIYVGSIPGLGSASDTNSGNHTAPFLTLGRAISYIESIATATGADTTLEYKILITGEVNNTPDTTVPEIGSSLNGKAGKIIIKGRSGTSPSLTNPNANGRVLTIDTSVPVEISNLTIKNGNASGSGDAGKGGALYINGTGTSVTLTNCTIQDSSANTSGGGLFVSGAGTNVTLNNCTIRDCSAATFGGALYVADGTSSSPATVTLNNSLIGGELTSCAGSAPVANSGSNSSNGGGGICIESNGKVVLSNTRVIGNIAQNYGGGIRCVAGTLNITKGQINYNYSGDSGGGLFIMGGASITIDKCTIGKTCTDTDTTATGLTDCGNYSASNGGGGIRIEGGTITTTEGYIVSKNYSAGTGANGGGISTSVNLELRNTKIAYNKTTGDGGGVFIEGAAEVTTRITNSNYSNYINNNSAENGGGICVSNAGAFFKTVESPYINENTATNGAGIYSVGLLEFSKLSINGNNASSNGGGIYTTGTMFFYGSSQIGSSGVNGINTAGSAGGGIYNTGNLYVGYSAWTDEATNTISTTGSPGLYGNKAPLGAGIYSTGTVYFARGSIFMHTGSGSNSGAGLYLAGGSFTMNGTASISSNTAQQRGAGIYVDATTENVSVTIGGTAQIYQNKSVETGGAIYIENGATTSATITLKDGIKIPYYTLTGTNATTYAGKNDVYFNGGLITVSETEALTDTAEVNVTPASYTIGQPLLTGTGIDANYSKIYIQPDSSHPNEGWDVSTTGKLCKPVLKSSSYSSITDFSNAIKNDEDDIDVIIDSDITAADLGKSNTIGTIAYGIRHNTNTNAKISLYVAPGVTIQLDTAANASLFDSCTKLVYADLEGCTTSSVTDMSHWFMGCTNLRELNLSGWNTSSVNSMTSMFDGCTRLEKIYVSTFVTAMASSSNNMFYGCTSIIGGLGTTFDSEKTNRDYAHLDGGDTNPGYFSSFQIGSKAMGETLELGDIIFSDGSAEPYSESLVLTPRQYLSAVAVIYDAENRKGVNLKEVRKAWAALSAEGHAITVGTDADDGTANMAEIQALSDWSEAKYPAFWYADHYGESAPVAGSTTGWYLPAKNELKTVFDNVTAVNNSIAKITGATALTKKSYYPYWTSNNNTGTSSTAKKWAIFIDNGSPGSTGDPRLKETDNYVRCIRVF